MQLSTAEHTIITTAIEIIERKFYERTGALLDSPAVVRQYLRIKTAHLQHEVFLVMFLNSQNRVIAIEEMFRGTIDGASVYPREVAKTALKHNAAAVIFAHNHPSGQTEPSTADRTITVRLVQALDLLDIRVLDHFVVGPVGITSFAERGLL